MREAPLVGLVGLRAHNDVTSRRGGGEKLIRAPSRARDIFVDDEYTTR